MINQLIYYVLLLAGMLEPVNANFKQTAGSVNFSPGIIQSLNDNLLFDDNEQLVKEIPIIAYHQIRNYTSHDKRYAKSITITPAAFAAQIKILYDSGYHSILPDQLYDYLAQQKQLPAKPVMISFDDGSIGQFSEAAPILKKYGFKAVFFIMTISTGKAGYLSAEQIKELARQGHVIGAHTWDHHNVTNYTRQDWKKQLDEPGLFLEKITGLPTNYFAYPYGAWNEEAIKELKKRNYKLAFILHTPRSTHDDLYTVRRMMANSSWTPKSMLYTLQKAFN